MMSRIKFGNSNNSLVKITILSQSIRLFYGAAMTLNNATVILHESDDDVKDKV